jgi:hypothetical protein
MDGSQFDALTRRSVGLAAGGLTAALFATAGIAGTEAKKKKRKKCRKFGERCHEGGRKKCCCGLHCRPPLNGLPRSQGNNHVLLECCHKGGEECEFDSDCCSNRCEGDYCFCKGNGELCGVDTDCCSYECSGTPSTCQPVT